MPTRRRLYATWGSAAVLLVAGAALLLSGTGAVAESPAVHRAGLGVADIVAAVLLAGAVSLLTPTVLFLARRRRYRRVLIAEGA